MSAPLPGPTPYSGGLFAFDIYVPDNYPQTNPKVQLITTGGGRVRFGKFWKIENREGALGTAISSLFLLCFYCLGPNLSACGKVCLSLLGTWSGPGWDPKQSSLYQVLMSIQGLILGMPWLVSMCFGVICRLVV